MITQSELRNLRKQAGLSQEEAAKMLGMSLKQVWRWENGLASPHLAVLNTYIEKLQGVIKARAPIKPIY